MGRNRPVTKTLFIKELERPQEAKGTAIVTTLAIGEEGGTDKK